MSEKLFRSEFHAEFFIIENKFLLYGIEKELIAKNF